LSEINLHDEHLSGLCENSPLCGPRLFELQAAAPTVDKPISTYRSRRSSV